MPGDDTVRCPDCSRYVDAPTPTLDHADDCRWADVPFADFRDTVRGRPA